MPGDEKQRNRSRGILRFALLPIRLPPVALSLYLFLFLAIMKTGIGAVRGQRKRERTWSLRPKRARAEPGAAYPSRCAAWSSWAANPGADIVNGAGLRSGRHARFSLMGKIPFVEDPTTPRHGRKRPVHQRAHRLRNGDTVNAGDVAIREVCIMSRDKCPYRSTQRTRRGAVTTFGSRTDAGCVRDHNEWTALVVAPLPFAVADGMGGHAAGEVASGEIAVNVLAELALKDPGRRCPGACRRRSEP